MSSEKEKIRNWYFRDIPEETRNRIDEQIERIRTQEEATEHEQQTLTRMVKELAKTLEAIVDDPSKISVIIKAIANGRISDDVIEKALPDDSKQRTRPKKSPQNATQIRLADLQRPVTVASDGSTHTDDRIPLSTDKGKGVFIPDEAEDEEEEEQEHKQQEASLQQLQQYKIILSAALLRGLGKLMLQKAEKAPNKKNFCIEHDITTKELFVYEAEEGEERNALGDDER